MKLIRSGEKARKLLFRRREATMLVCDDNLYLDRTVTEYSIFWTEEGVSPFAGDMYDVYVSVWEKATPWEITNAPPNIRGG